VRMTSWAHLPASIASMRFLFAERGESASELTSQLLATYSLAAGLIE
jgi:hypothetical protein